MLRIVGIAEFAHDQRVVARFGDAASQRGFGVAIDGVGSVFVSGSYAGHLDLGSGALPEAGPATYSFVGRL